MKLLRGISEGFRRINLFLLVLILLWLSVPASMIVYGTTAGQLPLTIVAGVALVYLVKRRLRRAPERRPDRRAERDQPG
jgi:membrane protein implicated in regulation of membrane protease activity